VLAVRSGEPRAVRDQLQGAPGISSLVMTGDGVHLVVDSAERRAPELRERLTASGTRFEKVEQVAPSIEDLFVHAVTGGQAA
jgi:ABC-2 type transport system ATP-binding protein